MADDNHEARKNETSPLRLKTPLTVWVLYFNKEFKLNIARELVKCLGVNFELLPIEKITSEIFHSTQLPDLLFVQTGNEWANKVARLQEADIVHSDFDMSLIVFGKDTDTESLKMALRLGASDYLSDVSTADELMPILCSVAEHKITSSDLAELFVFTNTKGGTGATTICLNCAVEMAKISTGKVLYLDLDMHFGVASDYLNIHSPYSISDAIANRDDLDEVSLQGLVAKHGSGLHLLSFDPDQHVENFEKVKELGSLLPILRKYYQYIFIDLSTGVDRLFTSIFSQSTKVVLVTQQHLAALKNTSRIVRLLKYEYGISLDSMELIINRYDKRQQIKLTDIAGSLVGIRLVTIPNDYKVAIESSNLGEPFVISKPNSAISRAIHELCRSLTPEEIKQEQGWLQRLFN